jgi:single-strand DNA-binding protein
MNGFNKVMLMGNVTRDPQLKYLPSQTPVAEFGLAVNRKYRTAQGEDREEVAFVEMSAFGKQAEVINEYCKKGKPLFVEGRLKYDQWDDKETGNKRSRLSVIVENFQFIGSREGGDGGGGEQRGGGSSASEKKDETLWKESPNRPANKKGRQTAGAGSAKYKEADIPF